jgi:hypothetical protein
MMTDNDDNSKNNDYDKAKGGHPGKCGKCGNHGSKGKVGKGVTIIKDYLIPFVSFALNRFMVLCSGRVTMTARERMALATRVMTIMMARERVIMAPKMTMMVQEREVRTRDSLS